MNKYIGFVALSCLVVSCKKKPEEQLVGKWQASALVNEGMTNLIRQERALLDTIGNKTPRTDWESRFGTTNLDSFKAEGRASLDGLEAQQKEAVTATQFEFRNDGIALVNFGAGPDSARYSLDDEGKLVMDEQALKGAGARLVMDILKVSDDSLTLRFTDNGFPSEVHFYRLRKD